MSLFCLFLYVLMENIKNKCVLGVYEKQMKLTGL